jgi:hypothetical protein
VAAELAYVSRQWLIAYNLEIDEWLITLPAGWRTTAPIAGLAWGELLGFR